MSVYSRNLPEGWWDSEQFHIQGHLQWVADKFGLESPPTKFLSDLLDDAAKQNIEWIDIRPGGCRAELFNWNDKKGLSLYNFMALRRLRQQVDTPKATLKVEQDERLGRHGLADMATWGQF